MSDRKFVLDALIAEGSVEELFVLRLAVGGCATRIVDVRMELANLGAVVIPGNVLVSGEARVQAVYVDLEGDVRLLRHAERVGALISVAGAGPGLRAIPSGRVEDVIAELEDSCVVVVNATLEFSVLVTERVIDAINHPAPADITIAKRGFFEAKEEYETGDAFSPSLVQDVSDKTTLTYFVRNTGLNAVEVQIEVSPDSVHWEPDGIVFSIAPFRNALLAPLHFVRFVRLRFRSAVAGLGTRIHIWFQAQA